jgi:hypothetical protein
MMTPERTETIGRFGAFGSSWKFRQAKGQREESRGHGGHERKVEGAAEAGEH